MRVRTKVDYDDFLSEYFRLDSANEVRHVKREPDMSPATNYWYYPLFVFIIDSIVVLRTGPYSRIVNFTDGPSTWDVEDVGTKGANLCDMTNLGLNVPPGFVIASQFCQDFGQQLHHLHSDWSTVKDNSLPDHLEDRLF